MRCAIVIPARRGSARFPGKPLAGLRGATGQSLPLIARTIAAGQAAAGAHELIVATDDTQIAEAAWQAGARAVMTPPTCRNGTERCAAALEAGDISADIIVNLQGDAPLTPPSAITALIDTLAADPAIAVTTPMIRCSRDTTDRLRADEAKGRVGGTSVVMNRAGDALYFSKRLIPHGGGTADCPLFLHIGLYAFRSDALLRYAEASPSPLEFAEGLEQLRFLDLGTPIRMVEIEEPAGGIWEVNNPEDIAIVERALALRTIA